MELRMSSLLQAWVLLHLVAGALGSVEYFFSTINGTCRASNQINQGDNLGGLCAYVSDVNRVYSCPAGEDKCWTCNQQCAAANNAAGANQVPCGAWCCDSRFEECPKAPNRINVCVAIVQKVPNPLSGFAVGTPVASAATVVDSQFTSTGPPLTSKSSSSTTSSPPSASAATGPPTDDNGHNHSRHNRLSPGAIAGLIIGATVGILLGATVIGLGALWLGKRFMERRNQQMMTAHHQLEKNSPILDGSPQSTYQKPLTPGPLHSTQRTQITPGPPHNTQQRPVTPDPLHITHPRLVTPDAPRSTLQRPVAPGPAHVIYRKPVLPEPIRELGEPDPWPSELPAFPSIYKI